ncbi:hypothetical protein FOXG_19602 [Fusarium oxysporum f. sp. lycopersici 4287]|uniref:Uncharacterized protein n=1 Tax=Fusarium oxysporum f. sp. lycopersici (strain 4287 / CBS 123668 / FGSC 9935 / NRRL 34936) TaxID=426428 RepID=A0A0J9V4Q8_FUSO4|nr:hypothetical protein FOXG_19602 [Fusarium oxysporum f. sp. lycopersici 4287]KNB06215.1 hypothetical protein FOXG_19602 [Fusarium oxysporum f. sp. lycopersici 4287]
MSPEFSSDSISSFPLKASTFVYSRNNAMFSNLSARLSTLASVGSVMARFKSAMNVARIPSGGLFNQFSSYCSINRRVRLLTNCLAAVPSTGCSDRWLLQNDMPVVGVRSTGCRKGDRSAK